MSKVTIGKSDDASMIEFPYSWVKGGLSVNAQYLEEVFNVVAPVVEERFKEKYGKNIIGPKCMALVENIGIYRKKKGEQVGVEILKRIIRDNKLNVEVSWPSLEIEDWFM